MSIHSLTKRLTKTPVQKKTRVQRNSSDSWKSWEKAAHVVDAWVGQVVVEVLQGSLAGHDGLDKESEPTPTGVSVMWQQEIHTGDAAVSKSKNRAGRA